MTTTTTRARWWETHKVDVPEGDVGRWGVRRFDVTEEDARFQHIRAAIGGGIRRRTFIVPGTYTRLIRWGEHGPDAPMSGVTVMSDTPDEIADHLGAIREVTLRGGRVLIHGLGLGMVVAAALRCDGVTGVDVVELEQDVIDLVGPHYTADPRVTIHHGDALTFRFPPGRRWSVVWHDIWPNICADNLPDMERLHRRYGSRCDWQGSWARTMCEDAR